MRDLGQKQAPVYEVSKSHHYQESQTHRSDLKSLQGPIYQQSAHSFSDGYAAPKARRYKSIYQKTFSKMNLFSVRAKRERRSKKLWSANFSTKPNKERRQPELPRPNSSKWPLNQPAEKSELLPLPFLPLNKFLPLLNKSLK